MKKKLNLFEVKGLTLLLLVASLLMGCSDTLAPLAVDSAKNPALTSASKRAFDLQSVQSVGVAPIYFAGAGRSRGGSSLGSVSSPAVLSPAVSSPSVANNSMANNPMADNSLADNSLGQDDVKALNEELLKSFDAELSLKVLNLYQGEGQAGKVGRGAIGGGLGGKAFDLASSAAVGADAVSLGRAAGVDAVLITSMKSYKERVGSAVGADSPARVSFTMSLVRVSDRSEIWSAIYTFQDRSLLDNLTTLGPAQEGGLGWRKAREIVVQAFTNSARDLEDKRLAQFLTR